MKKSEFIEKMKSGAEVMINHDRCSVDNKTVRCSYVDEMFDNDKLVFVGKPNNFTRAYKMADSEI